MSITAAIKHVLSEEYDDSDNDVFFIRIYYYNIIYYLLFQILIKILNINLFFFQLSNTEEVKQVPELLGEIKNTNNSNESLNVDSSEINGNNNSMINNNIKNNTVKSNIFKLNNNFMSNESNKEEAYNKMNIININNDNDDSEIADEDEDAVMECNNTEITEDNSYNIQNHDEMYNSDNINKYPKKCNI